MFTTAEFTAIKTGRQVHETYPGSFAVALPHLDDTRFIGQCAACHREIGNQLAARRCTDGALIHLGVYSDGRTFDCRTSS